MVLKGKNIVILGAGTSGISAARLAASCGASATVYDNGSPDNLANVITKLAGYGIPLVAGDIALQVPSEIDSVVLSPGIPRDSDIARAFSEHGNDLIGEIEFSWQLSRNVPVIAITGTNGKTTTTGLIAAIVRGAGLSTIPCGNIGLAYSEVVRSDASLDLMTVELSSFQLESIVSFRPKIAVWMNFAPDHMDRYRSIAEYRNAKEQIFKNQTEADWCVVKKEDEMDLTGKVVTFSAFTDSADFWYDEGMIWGPGKRCLLNYQDTGMHGLHNAENVMAAMAAAHCLGIDFEDMIGPVMKYRAPAHRSEVVGTKGGVVFVNDSKATNLHALESSLRGQDSPVVLIAGGKKKGLNFSELNDIIRTSVKEVICLGETAVELEEVWGGIVPCHYAADLTSAVDVSYSLCSEGDTVLFSPGTSSFDMFSGYEERGEFLRNAVERLDPQLPKLDKFNCQQQPK